MWRFVGRSCAVVVAVAMLCACGAGIAGAPPGAHNASAVRSSSSSHQFTVLYAFKGGADGGGPQGGLVFDSSGAI